MRKHRDEYDSPIDALITIAKRLSVNENRYHMSSEDFFDRFSKGQLEDSDGPLILNVIKEAQLLAP